MSVDEIFEKNEKVVLESQEELFAIQKDVDYGLLNSSLAAYTDPEDIIEKNLLKMNGCFPGISPD